MKAILVTDTHCGIKRGKGNLLRLFDSIYQYADEHKIKTLIHLGDYWHNRKSIDIQSLLVGLGVADNIDAVFREAYIITGNHDTIYKDDVKTSLLSVFDKHKNIHIVNEVYAWDNLIMVPWLFDSEILENKEEYEILLGHFDINGAVMNSAGTEAQGGRYNKGDFNNFKLVLSGHYHTPGVYGNIRYLGSPYHMNFNDVDSERGFYVIDTKTLEVEFVENTRYWKYRRIKDTDVVPELKPSYIKDSIVELIFTKDYGIDGNIELIEQVKRMEPHTLIPKYVSIDESMAQEDIAQEDIEVKDHLEILQEYYEYSEQPEHIDLKTLGKVAEMIYKETISE